MSHFAEIDENNKVLRVVVAEQDFIDSGVAGDPANWKRASYNTSGGKHAFEVFGDKPFRKNFPGKGWNYDPARDAFIPDSPYPSWILNEETCLWEAPVPYPNDGDIYNWDESTVSWKWTRPNPINK